MKSHLYGNFYIMVFNFAIIQVVNCSTIIQIPVNSKKRKAF
jgi:hypothetical protein